MTLNPTVPINADIASQKLTQIDQLIGQATSSIIAARVEEGEKTCKEILSMIDGGEIELSLDLRHRLGDCHIAYGRICTLKSDLAAALDHFSFALDIYEGLDLKRDIALCNSYLGANYISLGDYAKAAELLEKSVKQAQEIEDEALVGEVLNDLGFTYIMAGNPEPAIPYLERSIRILRQYDDPMRLSWALDSLGQAFLQMGKKQQALASILEGYKYCRRAKSWYDELRFMGSVGKAYRECGETLSAQEVFSELLKLSRQHGCKAEECDSLLSLADIEIIQGHAVAGLVYLDQALRIANDTGLKHQLSEVFRLKALAHKQNKDYQAALEAYESFLDTTRQLFNKDADQRMKNLQVIHQVENARKEAEIYQLRAFALQKEVEERRRTQAILEQLARTDALTGILNRRAFFEQANIEFGRIKTDHQPLALILIDVDHFKRINDQYGHQAGDQALALVVERLRARMRSMDFLARIGGEEFAAILPATTLDQAGLLAERLRSAISDQPLHLAEGIDFMLTLSLGIASSDPEAPLESLDLLISHADQALYRAKRSGRNQVKKHSPRSA